MARKRVKYFFAFVSPFAALADARIDDVVTGAGADLVPIPLVPPQIGGPLTGVAAQLREFRLSYGREDAVRWARKLDLRWQPHTAVVDSSDAVAGWYAAAAAGKERGYRNAVFRARWSEGRDIADREVLADCAARAGVGRDAFLDALAARRHHDDVPKALQQCLEERIFGVPTFVVDGQRFWGNDRIDFLLDELRGAAG